MTQASRRILCREINLITVKSLDFRLLYISGISGKVFTYYLRLPLFERFLNMSLVMRVDLLRFWTCPPSQVYRNRFSDTRFFSCSGEKGTRKTTFGTPLQISSFYC